MTTFIKTQNMLAEARVNRPQSFIAFPCNGMIRKDKSLVIGDKQLKAEYPSIEKDMGAWVRRTGVRAKAPDGNRGLFYRYRFTIHPSYPQIMLLQTKLHWKSGTDLRMLKHGLELMLEATEGVGHEIHLVYPEDSTSRSRLYPILSDLPDHVFVWYRWGYR